MRSSLGRSGGGGGNENMPSLFFTLAMSATTVCFLTVGAAEKKWTNMPAKRKTERERERERRERFEGQSFK